jgi:hypothetical protein
VVPSPIAALLLLGISFSSFWYECLIFWWRWQLKRQRTGYFSARRSLVKHICFAFSNQILNVLIINENQARTEDLHSYVRTCRGQLLIGRGLQLLSAAHAGAINITQVGVAFAHCLYVQAHTHTYTPSTAHAKATSRGGCDVGYPHVA